MWTKPDGHYAKFKWVEVARWLDFIDDEGHEQKMVARYMTDVKKKIPKLFPLEDVPKIAQRTNNVGIYTSLFRYASGPTLDTSAVQLGNLYFDVDSDDPELALIEARKLVDHLTDYIDTPAVRIYFTGKKGYHIECEAAALGITPSKELPAIYRLLANDLKEQLDLTTIDFACYESRRMWRLVNSQHQFTGLYKIPLRMYEEFYDLNHLDHAVLAEKPRPVTVPDQVFSLRANEWYREYTYRYEQSKIQQRTTASSIIERFNKHGSMSMNDTEREFDPIKLFEGCPAIQELWTKAETTRNLEHEERLFLCSLLTYTDEAIEYLHAILSNCDDYNFEKSQSHIDDWVRRREMGIGGRPYTCRRARDAGIVCTGCENLEAKPKYEEIGGKLYQTDQVSEPSPIRLVYRRKSRS